jgi:hypothetical protein
MCPSCAARRARFRSPLVPPRLPKPCTEFRKTRRYWAAAVSIGTTISPPLPGRRTPDPEILDGKKNHNLKVVSPSRWRIGPYGSPGEWSGCVPVHRLWQVLTVSSCAPSYRPQRRLETGRRRSLRSLTCRPAATFRASLRATVAPSSSRVAAAPLSTTTTERNTP